MSTHRGKIGRLPAELREQVNRRLENGEKGLSVIAWLNSLPEVRAILAAEFQGKPISEVNLTHWRMYGYKDWLRRREAVAMAAEIGELPVAGNSPRRRSNRHLGLRPLPHGRARNRPAPRRRPVAFPHHPRITRDAIALRRLEHRSARPEFEKERLIYDRIPLV